MWSLRCQRRCVTQTETVILSHVDSETEKSCLKPCPGNRAVRRCFEVAAVTPYPASRAWWPVDPLDVSSSQGNGGGRIIRILSCEWSAC